MHILGKLELKFYLSLLWGEMLQDNEVKLNVEQLQVYEEVFRSVNNEEHRIYFLDAPRGTEVHGAKGLTTTVSGN